MLSGKVSIKKNWEETILEIDNCLDFKFSEAFNSYLCILENIS